MLIRTFYCTLSMAFVVTATHQQTLEESEVFFFSSTHKAFRSRLAQTHRRHHQDTKPAACRVIDWFSGSDKQGVPGPLADTKSNDLDEHLEVGVGFAGVHSRTQSLSLLRCCVVGDPHINDK